MDSLLEFFRLQEGDNFLLFWVKEFLIALLVFAAFWLLSRVVRYAMTTLLPKVTSRTGTDLDDRVLARITPPSALLVIFAGIYYAVRSLPLPDKVQIAASGGIFVISTAIFTNIAYRALHELLGWYGARVAERTGAGPDRLILPLAEKIITIFLVGAALIVTLKHFGYDILSLVTALGIGSLAIGMAAKDTLANMISGFTLMIDRPFRIGDRIQLSGGQWGDVEDIGLRSTKIKTADNTLLIIPNSDLCNSAVVNMAFPDVKSKGRVNVGVSYGSDVELVKQLLVRTAVEIPEVLKDPAPEAFFVSFGESAMNMALFFWVADYTLVFSVADRINTMIITRFREHGIEIPYPTRTVLLENQV